MKLFVDDTRPFPTVGYQCCRTAEQAKILLAVLDFDYISLDYSLGSDSENGLDLLVWMKDNGISVPAINIHSNHTVGRDLMYQFIADNFPDTEITMVMLDK